MKMIYLNRFLLLAVIGAALVVSLPVISKADDPKETSIHGSIRLPEEGNQEAAQAKLATIPLQTAIDTAVSTQGGTVLRAELQNEDGFLVYNVELVSADKKVHEIKVDAGKGSILRIDVDSADRETENEERAD
jgi:uncharacterized membrane protein YkoI